MDTLLKAVAEKPTDNIAAIAQQRVLLDIGGSRDWPDGACERDNTPNSHPLHKALYHLLLPSPVERDGELVALNVHDVAVAELLVKHAIADRVG
jgi:hypothetical protein